MKLRRTLKMLLAITTPVLMLAGCGVSAPASVSGLRSVMGNDLIGAVGATPADQRKIDRTIVRGCAGGIWSRGECARHDEETRNKEGAGR